MQINLKRMFTSKESTQGALYINGEPFCFTLEDEFREIKVSGETRIPKGNYKIKYRDAVTPLTEKYRKKHPWFTFHLEIQDVPNFKYIYMHKGNIDNHTEGCILLGDSLNNNQVADGFLGHSTNAFTRFYKLVSKALDDNEDVSILIEDLG